MFLIRQPLKHIGEKMVLLCSLFLLPEEGVLFWAAAGGNGVDRDGRGDNGRAKQGGWGRPFADE